MSRQFADKMRRFVTMLCRAIQEPEFAQNMAKLGAPLGVEHVDMPVSAESLWRTIRAARARMVPQS